MTTNTIDGNDVAQATPFVHGGVHFATSVVATARYPMDMANQQDTKDEQEARIQALVEQFRAAEKRALLKRGIELWTRTEGALLETYPLPAAKVH